MRCSLNTEMEVCLSSSTPTPTISFSRASPHFIDRTLRSLHRSLLQCNSSNPLKTLTTEPPPLLTSIKSFAPATIANFGPGFDFLGCAVDDIGDHVTLTIDPRVEPGKISISKIEGVGDCSNKLSRDPGWNCAGIAAMAAMNAIGVRSVGLSLSLEKGMPLGSGLGSSAASAAAAAYGVNEMFGGPLDVFDLVAAAIESEAQVSGYHADNVAPAIMGGFVLIRSYDPLEIVRLKFPADSDLLFVLGSPEFEAPTKKMRDVLPKEIGLPDHIWNCSRAGALVASILQGDLRGLGMAMSSDRIVEPRRGPLIPGFEEVKKSAMEAGALGCTISGSGPTAIAVTDCADRGRRIGDAMMDAFMRGGNLKSSSVVKRLDRIGARTVASIPV